MPPAFWGWSESAPQSERLTRLNDKAEMARSEQQLGLLNEYTRKQRGNYSIFRCGIFMHNTRESCKILLHRTARGYTLVLPEKSSSKITWKIEFPISRSTWNINDYRATLTMRMICCIFHQYLCNICEIFHHWKRKSKQKTTSCWIESKAHHSSGKLWTVNDVVWVCSGIFFESSST